jgi:uncharacterized protein DUF4383
MTYERPFAPVQWAAIIGSIGVLFWSVPGIFVNPDFATGDSATAERVMGVDMNGWHALSGFLLVLPLPIALMRARYAALFCLAAAVGLSATGVWALLDSQVAGGLFYLPNGGADALLHFSVAAIFLAGGTHYFLTERQRHQHA